MAVDGKILDGAATPYDLKDRPAGNLSIRLEKSGYLPVDTSVNIIANKSSEVSFTLKPEPKLFKAEDSIRIFRDDFKKHGRRQIWSLASTVVAGGAGGYFFYAAEKKYQEYLVAENSQATKLRETAELYDKLGPVFLGVAGLCAVEFTIQTIKKNKSKVKLQLSPGGAKLSFNF